MSSPFPSRTIGLTSVIAVAAGESHSLGLKSDGTVWSWGNGNFGDLGQGTIIGSRYLPIRVKALSSIVSIAAGTNFSVAVGSDGKVWTWGWNGFGQLGDGSNGDHAVPEQVQELKSIVAVDAGMQHAVALSSDGTVWAWGANNSGQLGNGGTANGYVPTRVTGLTKVVAVSAGAYHNLALRSDGTVWAWGANSAGELGTVTPGPMPSAPSGTVPHRVPNLRGVAAVAAGGSHSLAITSDGAVWAWGQNTAEQAGGVTREDVYVPQRVPGIGNAVAVAGGLSHSVALTTDGRVWTWGSNEQGQLGEVTGDMSRNVPDPVTDIVSATMIAAGANYTMVVVSASPFTQSP